MKYTPDDQDLIRKIRSGNPGAFKALYNRYWESLYAAALWRLQSREYTKDVVQELFVDLWEKREELHIRSNVKGYLFTALKHRIINRIKSEKVRAKYENMVIEFYELNELATEHRFSEKNIRDEIRKEAEKLPARCREVFELSRVHQLSHKEIGEKLNISPKTVENHITKALKAIRPKLKHIISVLFTLFWGV